MSKESKISKGENTGKLLRAALDREEKLRNNLNYLKKTIAEVFNVPIEELNKDDYTSASIKAGIKMTNNKVKLLERKFKEIANEIVSST